MFDCLKVAISSKENGGYVAKTTRCIEQIHVVNMDRLQYFLLALANKYAKILDERYIFERKRRMALTAESLWTKNILQFF